MPFSRGLINSVIVACTGTVQQAIKTAVDEARSDLGGFLLKRMAGYTEATAVDLINKTMKEQVEPAIKKAVIMTLAAQIPDSSKEEQNKTISLDRLGLASALKKKKFLHAAKLGAVYTTGFVEGALKYSLAGMIGGKFGFAGLTAACIAVDRLQEELQTSLPLLAPTNYLENRILFLNGISKAGKLVAKDHAQHLRHVINVDIPKILDRIAQEKLMLEQGQPKTSKIKPLALSLQKEALHLQEFLTAGKAHYEALLKVNVRLEKSGYDRLPLCWFDADAEKVLKDLIHDSSSLSLRTLTKIKPKKSH